MTFKVKASAIFKNIAGGLLGIGAEMLAVIVLILAGFLVCIFWWGILVK